MDMVEIIFWKRKLIVQKIEGGLLWQMKNCVILWL